MDILTHLSMSLQFKRMIEKNFPVKLNTFRFMFGSIKPDISSQFQQIPHFKEDASDFINEEIQNLLKIKINRNNRCTAQFSENLGIITHYLSDFFCHAHKKYFDGGTLKHFLYEAQLFFYFIARREAYSKFDEQHEIEIEQEQTLLMAYLERLHKEYMLTGNQTQQRKDIQFTFNACMSLCFSIMAVCLASEPTLPAAEMEKVAIA